MNPTFLIEVTDDGQAMTQEGKINMAMCEFKPHKYSMIACTSAELPFVIQHLNHDYCKQLTVNGTRGFKNLFNELVSNLTKN